MTSNKNRVKKIVYVSWLVVLAVIFVSSLSFGVIAAFFNDTTTSIETWYLDSFEEEIVLLTKSITWLLISAALLMLTLSYKDFKKTFID